MLKTLNEWASENQHQLADLEVLYDEDLVTSQVNGWLQKLTGLCSPVPIEHRPELVEQIIKAIRQQLL